MATYITLAQQAGSQLLEANRRQTIANRQGLAKQEKARQVATQQQEHPPPVPVSGSRRVMVPGDELAAFRQTAKSTLGHFWLFDANITQGATLTYRYFRGGNLSPNGPYFGGAIYTESSSLPSSYESYFATGNAKQIVSVLLEVTEYPEPPDLTDDPEIVLSSSGMEEWTARIMHVSDGYLYGGYWWEYYWVYDGYEECSPVSGGSVYSSITDSISWSLSLSQRKAVTSITHDFDQRHLILPAGNGSFIVIVLLSCSWVMRQRYVYATRLDGAVLPTDSYFNIISKVFICNNSSCRLISAPQILQEIINQINPGYETVSSDTGWLFAEEYIIPRTTSCPPSAEPWRTDHITTINNGVKSGVGWQPYQDHAIRYTYQSDSIHDTYYSQASLPDYEPAVYSGLKAQAAITPSIYAALNDVFEFVSSDLIKTLPESKNWIVESEITSNLSRSYGIYSLYGNPDDNTGGSVTLAARFNFSISSPYHPDFPDPTSEDFSGTLFTIWDWDDPIYCRQMLGALGFSSADLVP